MAEPTDEQLREYAAKLPKLYREIFEAFYHAFPERRQHDALTRESLLSQLDSSEYDMAEILEGVGLLIEGGFLKSSELGTFRLVRPSALGERLMEVLTGKVAPKRGAPPLPVPTWG